MLKKCCVLFVTIWVLVVDVKPQAALDKPQDVFYGEVGLTGGGGFVLGDVNGMLFNHMQPLGGVFLKYKFNGHYELRLQVDGGILGVGNVNNTFCTTPYVGAQFLGEFNFFNYGVKQWEAFRTWVTPTIIAGLGVMAFDDGVSWRFTPTLPLGVGVKFKLSNRVNVGAYWMVTKTFSDAVDHTDNPIGLNKGLWNNRDWYSTAQIYLSINFYKICAPCRNGVIVKRKK